MKKYDPQRAIKRKNILDAAGRIFLQKGYSQTTIKTIANSASVSPGNLYLYFKGKDDIYISLSMDAFQEFIEDFETIAISRSKPIKISELKASFVTCFENHDSTLKKLIQWQTETRFDRLSEENNHKLNDLIARLLDKITHIIGNSMDLGLFNKTNPRIITDIIMSLFIGNHYLQESIRQMNLEKAYSNNTLEMALDILFQGL